MRCAKTTRIAASGLLFVAMNLAAATMPLLARGRLVVLAQAMIPRTGMTDAQHPMPMNERYLKRFPQPARVGDLIGLPVLDLDTKTLGHVQQIVRTPDGKIKFIVSYSRWWGWFGRPIAVPLEVLGIEGRHLMSLDMPPSEYETAPTWRDTEDTPLLLDATARRAFPQLNQFMMQSTAAPPVNLRG